MYLTLTHHLIIALGRTVHWIKSAYVWLADAVDWLTDNTGVWLTGLAFLILLAIYLGGLAGGGYTGARLAVYTWIAGGPMVYSLYLCLKNGQRLSPP